MLCNKRCDIAPPERHNLCPECVTKHSRLFSSLLLDEAFLKIDLNGKQFKPSCALNHF